MSKSGKELLLNAVCTSNLDMDGFQLLNLDASNLGVTIPSQSGNATKYLKTNGTTLSWGSAYDAISISTDAAWLTVDHVLQVPPDGSIELRVRATANMDPNLILATPTSGTGVVTARSLVAGDIPSLNVSKLNAGTLSIARGGTSMSSYLIGDLIFANGVSSLDALHPIAAGNVLKCFGVGITPGWGKVTSTHVDSSILVASNNLSDVTTVATARNNILPSQGSASGKFLTSDGTNATWATVAGSGTFTSFAFTDANGFHGSVANATTAPALTLVLADTITPDVTKTATFDLSNITTGTNRVVNVPNANSTTAQVNAGASHNFLTAMSAQGVFTKAQPAVADVSDFNTSIAPAYTILTDGATVTWTMDATKVVQNAKVTLAGNRTLAFASATEGMSGVLIVVQDGTGSRTLVLPATSKVVNNGSGAVVLTTAAAGVDILGWVKGPSAIYWTILNNFS